MELKRTVAQVVAHGRYLCELLKGASARAFKTKASVTAFLRVAVSVIVSPETKLKIAMIWVSKTVLKMNTYGKMRPIAVCMAGHRKITMPHHQDMTVTSCMFSLRKWVRPISMKKILE